VLVPLQEFKLPVGGQLMTFVLARCNLCGRVWKTRKYRLHKVKCCQGRQMYYGRGQIKDYTDKQIGYIYVLRREGWKQLTGRIRQRVPTWRVVCTLCGRELVMTTEQFQAPNLVSCGCYNRKITIQRLRNKAIDKYKKEVHK